MTSQEAQNIIDQFFLPEKDGEHISTGKVKRSVILALQEDLKFAVLLPGKWRPLQLTIEQNKYLNTMIPTFTVISLFCTGVDVMARVWHKRLPPRYKNGIYFKGCAKRWFKITRRQSSQLWMLRNGISHNYRLQFRQIAEQFGYGGVLRRTSKGYYVFYLHAMYTHFDQARYDLYNYLSNQSTLTKKKTALYLKNNGFFYTL